MAELDTPIMVPSPEDDVREQTPRIKLLLKHCHSEFHDLRGWAHGFPDLKTEETAAPIRRFLDR